MPNYDLTNLALQIAAPNNVLLYDDVGEPSVMVRIPKFKISDVIDGGSDDTHPAFIINGVEKDSVYISKYQNIVNNGRAYSLPMQGPAAGNISHDNAWDYCKAKGKGWHCMTFAEWAAVALWCKANGFMPNGNNNFGKDISEGSLPVKALPTYVETSGAFRTLRVATGSGRVSWYHDNTEAGIADLNGNVWEWTPGMRLMNGEIQVLANNDAADWNNPVTAASSLWRGIDATTGALTAPGSANNVKYGTAWSNTKFSSITTTPAATGAGLEMLEALCLLPHTGSTSADYGEDAVWATLTDERVPRRGGTWSDGASSGVFALALHAVRSNGHTTIGFRSAYVDLS